MEKEQELEQEPEKEQERRKKIKKRSREVLEARNSDEELHQTEIPKKKKKKKNERRADDVHQSDAPFLHSGLQAEEQRQEKRKPKHASPGESKSALTGSESGEQHLHGKILHRENGHEEKLKKELKKRQCKVLGGGDLGREIVKAKNRAEEKKKKKKRKEKSNEQLEEGNFHKDIAEELGEDKFSREEEKTKEKGRKKDKKKERKMKDNREEGLQEEEEQKRHLQRENATLMNGADTMGSESGNLNKNSIEEETKKEKKKEKQYKKVTFEDPIVATDQDQVRDVVNEAECSSSEILTEDVEEIWGVRFTPEEDETLKNAIWSYIKSKGWDEHIGLDKVFNSKKHKDARDCWAEIKMSLPHRPRTAVRFRARLLLEAGNHLGKWSKEEEDILMRLQSEQGHKWRKFSSILNRQRSCIKEKWRSLKRADTLKEKGGWTQDELQQLSNMVHKSLRINRLLASKKEKPSRQILRDNISWEMIADTLGTHNHGPCCSKWYYTLQSSLVTDGHWANQDDFFLLESLLESGASAEEEVEWDKLLENRSGQVCLTRWKQMVKHLGENRTRQFLDKLDILAHRYAPELLETSVEDSTSKGASF